MSVDSTLQDRLRRRKEELEADRAQISHGGGSGREPPDFERRLSTVESSIASIDKTLAVITEQLKHVALQTDLASVRIDLATISGKLDTKANSVDLAELSGKLDMKANSVDLAELKGRVARIPTVPTLVSIGILVSLLFAAGSWVIHHLPPQWLS